MACSSTIYGPLISTLVSARHITKIDSRTVDPGVSTVRKKPTWKLVEPIERYLRPRKRTSHTWITYEDKIVL